MIMAHIGALRIHLFVIQCLICADSWIFVYGKVLVKAVDRLNNSTQSAGLNSVFLRENNTTQNASEKDNLTDFRRRVNFQNDLFIKMHLSHFVNISTHGNAHYREHLAKTGIFTPNTIKTHTILNVLHTGSTTIHGSDSDRYVSQVHHSQYSDNQELQKRRKRSAPVLDAQRAAVNREIATMLGVDEESLEDQSSPLGKRTFSRNMYIQQLYAAMRREDTLLENRLEGRRSLGTIRIYRGYRPKVHQRHSHTFHYDVSTLPASVVVSRAELVLELPGNISLSPRASHLNINVSKGGMKVTHNNDELWMDTDAPPGSSLGPSWKLIKALINYFARNTVSVRFYYGETTDSQGMTTDDYGGPGYTVVGELLFHADSVANFLVFNISQYADVFRGSFRLTMELSVDGEAIRIPRIRIPLLVFYQDIPYNPLIIHAHRENQAREYSSSGSSRRLSKRDVDSPYVDTSHIVSRFPEDYFDDSNQFRARACRRFSWDIDLTVFCNSIVAPEISDAGYCSGECDFPLMDNMNSTSYSFIKNLWHARTQFSDDYVPRACCTPVNYYPESIVYVGPSSSNPVMFIRVSNMRVATCGCR